MPAATDDTLSLDLRENAIDSLQSGVDHYLDASRRSALKYAVLHTWQAVCLFLKDRLAAIDADLIWEDPAKQGGTDRTVGIAATMRLLKENGIPLTSRQRKDLVRLQRVRNMMEHLRFDLSRRTVTDYLGHAYRFLDEFLHEELGTELSDALTKKSYDELMDSLYDWRERNDRARERAEAERPHGSDGLGFAVATCPDCGTDGIPVGGVNSGETVKCKDCGESFAIDWCSQCGEAVVGGFGEDDMDLCEMCEENLFA